MAGEENSRISLHMQLIAILSRIGVYSIQTQRKGNMLLGNKIRSLRDEQGILQRQVAAYLEIDTPMFSKIERGG